jgi:uncharacterized protein YjbJ (UPF0337 family)
MLFSGAFEEQCGVSAALPALRSKEICMGINKDQVEGRVKEAVGKVQEAAGKAVNSQQQQAKGLAKEVAGAAQKTYGDAKEAVKNHMKDSQQKQG